MLHARPGTGRGHTTHCHLAGCSDLPFAMVMLLKTPSTKGCVSEKANLGVPEHLEKLKHGRVYWYPYRFIVDNVNAVVPHSATIAPNG